MSEKSTPDARWRLPNAQQFVTTWLIPDQYAGQTTATLHRVRAAVARTQQPVRILTFDAMQDNGEVTQRLEERGILSEGVTVCNLFEELRRWESAGYLHERLNALPDVEAAPEWGDPIARVETAARGRREYAESGEVISAAIQRDDGSVLCRDFQVRTPEGKKRHQQWFFPDGSQAKLTGSAWDTYFLWLDDLVGAQDSVFVNESKTTARFMSRYDNPRASVIHLFHESHLADSSDPFKGELNKSHSRMVPHLDRFDGVVFLTEKQRNDVAQRFGGGASLYSVPNAGPPVLGGRESPLGSPRRGDRGIVVATLKPLKRLDHAIESVIRARSGGSDISLDLYGRDVGSRAGLERLVAQHEAQDYIRLRGYAAGASTLFSSASFSLMTSQTEGQSLVLLESMAAGCVPISYDIRYGPSELIVDGETGFLVEPGDVEAMAEAIRRFLALPRGQIRTLRNNCRSRLAAFSDDDIQQRWAAIQRHVAEGRPRRCRLAEFAMGNFEFAVEDSSIVFTARARARRIGAEQAPTACLLLTGRDEGVPLRIPLIVRTHSRAGEWLELGFEGSLEPVNRIEWPEKVLDVHLELSCGASSRIHRLRGEAKAEAGALGVFATGFGNVSVRR